MLVWIVGVVAVVVILVCISDIAFMQDLMSDREASRRWQKDHENRLWND